MTPEEQAKFEQSLTGMRNTLPKLWLSIFAGCLDAGFDVDQSFSLLQTYILSQNPNGIHPNKSYGIDPNDIP